LQRNLASIDFSVVLIGMMTIVDEIDSQLSEPMPSKMFAQEPDQAGSKSLTDSVISHRFSILHRWRKLAAADARTIMMHPPAKACAYPFW
jgi:hypothetical protein